MAWYLIAPDGTEIDLQASPYYLVRGASGMWWAPVAYKTQSAPDGEGELVLDMALRGRNVDLPLMVIGRMGSGLYGRIAALMSKVSHDPSQPSYLVWRGVVTRRLAVLQRGGAAWNEDTGATYARVVVSLYAPDPMWEDEAETSQVLSDIEGVPFLPTLIPIRLTPSNI